MAFQKRHSGGHERGAFGQGSKHYSINILLTGRETPTHRQSPGDVRGIAQRRDHAGIDQEQIAVRQNLVVVVVVQHLPAPGQDHGECFPAAATKDEALHAPVKFRFRDSGPTGVHQDSIHFSGDRDRAADLADLFSTLHAAQFHDSADQRSGTTGLGRLRGNGQKARQPQGRVALIGGKIMDGPASGLSHRILKLAPLMLRD